MHHPSSAPVWRRRLLRTLGFLALALLALAACESAPPIGYPCADGCADRYGRGFRREPYARAGSDAYTYAPADADANTISSTCNTAHAFCYTATKSSAYAFADTHGDAKSSAYAFADTHGDAKSSAYAFADTHGDANTQLSADAYPRAQAVDLVRARGVARRR